MNNTKSHAQRELDILIKTTPDAIIRDFIPEILAVCEAFGKSGQSGGSAPSIVWLERNTASVLSQVIKKLCLLSSVFKENGKMYYSDAISWKTQKGSTWHGTAKTKSGEEITSRQYIKSFPFKPQTFVIDVIEKEVSRDNWEFTIKNEKDLEKVWEVYNKTKII